MFHKILVPLDGSELAERALAPALALSQQAGGKIILLKVAAPSTMLVPDVHVFGGYGLIWPDQSLQREREEAAEYLQAIKNAEAPSSSVVRPEAASGDVAEAIVDTAAAEGVDLLVMSSHGYSGFTRWMLGSVAERVLHGIPCPALIIRSREPLRHILIPLDGSELSEQVLRAGFGVAGTLGSEVTLLRALPPAGPGETRWLDEIERGLSRRFEAERRAEAEVYLQRVADAHQSTGLAIKTVVLSGPAADGILNYANEHAINLIAMSTHGRTGLRRWVYGSVTEKVLRGAHQSMLIVRPAK